MKCKAKRIRKGCYEYRGYIIQSVGYYEPEHRVCWEAHLPDVNDYLFDDGTPDRPWLKCKSDMFDAFKKAVEE